MDTSKKPWPLSTIHGIRDRVDTNPDYQRPPVWTRAQKQLLIDTVLRNYDIPKLYWRRTGKKPDKYDVIDGQQRLRAIWEFFDGQFTLPRNADPIVEYPIAGLKYVDLPDELRIRLDTALSGNCFRLGGQRHEAFGQIDYFSWEQPRVGNRR